MDDKYSELREHYSQFKKDHPRATYMPWPPHLERPLKQIYYDSDQDCFVYRYNKLPVIYFFRNKTVLDAWNLPCSYSYKGKIHVSIMLWPQAYLRHYGERIAGYFRCKCGKTEYANLKIIRRHVVIEREGNEWLIVQGVRFPTACLTKLRESARARWERHRRWHELLYNALPSGHEIRIGDRILRRVGAYFEFKLPDGSVRYYDSDLSEVTGIGSWMEKNPDPELEKKLLLASA